MNRLRLRGAVVVVGGALACLSSVSPALASNGGTLSIVAGTGSQGAPTPGPAVSSQLNNPFKVTVDSAGNVYIADNANHEIEKVTPSGTLSVVAGTGSQGAPNPGPATSSPLNYPQAVAVDSAGNLYVADWGSSEILKVTPSGTLSVVAGTGSQGAPTPGPATNSSLGHPYGVGVDSAGNVYVADTYNFVIEKITPSGTLSIVAGTGSPGAPNPGPATSSQLGWTFGVAIDPAGNLYIADGSSHEIEKVTPSGILSIVAGTGSQGAPTPGPATSSQLNDPSGVAVDPTTGDVYIADTGSQEIEKVTQSGLLSIVAGTGSHGAPTPGPATSSQLDGPMGVGLNPTTGDVYIADSNNNEIEKVTPLAPSDTSAPMVTGIAQQGQTLTATDGTWANDPTGYGYQWQRCDSSSTNCTDIAGATAQSYTLTGSDVRHTLRVVVTASNRGGSQTSASVLTGVVPDAPPTSPPAPPLTVTVTGPSCPVALAHPGEQAGLWLGPVALGMSAAQAHKALPSYTVTHNAFDRACLAGGPHKIRVGYPSNQLLNTLTRPERSRMRGRVVLALTANDHYALDGIKPGTRVAHARWLLARAQRFQIGANTWYVLRGVHASGVLKVQHGVVGEIGIADRSLTTTRANQRRLLSSFPNTSVSPR